MTRRKVLKSGAAALIALPGVVPNCALAANKLTFASWGGSYGEQTQEFWIKPFTAETGIEVEYVLGPELAKMKAQVTSKNVLWDVVDGLAYPAEKEGLLEPIDYKVVDPNRFLVNAPSFAVPTGGYTGGIAYDPSRSPAPAKDFAQFWDVEDFPGRRGLRSRVSETLEMALLADGVAPAKLYPLDVERGFRALDSIKPHVRKWFAATAEGVSLLQTKEVEYTYTYGSRVAAAKDAGVSIEFSRDQCITSVQYFCVLKGSPHKEAAMRFLEFVSRPGPAAKWINKLGVVASPPVIKGVDELLDPGVRRFTPDPASSKHVFTDDGFWAEHFVELDKRFKEWILA
nr:ABC transporter substrate-binding protein [Bradyrhizobium acaciae]